MTDITPEWFHLLPYGYAPGSYMNRCISCGNVVPELDKRATRCKPCAVSAADNAALRTDIHMHLIELAALRERVKVLEDALRVVVNAYDAYRGRGVSPAPAEYGNLVDAIHRARAALEVPNG